MYNLTQVSINEAFSPFIGVDVTLQNNLTLKLEYRQTRALSLSMTSIQINEATSKDIVFGFGYRINNFNLFGGRNTRAVKSNKKRNDQTNTPTKSNGVNRDLNLRFDFSYRQQANLTRDISTLAAAASSGNTALKIAFMGDYTLSRLITASLYFDLQSNSPLLSANSYPTITHDFGINLKISLTR